MLAFILSRFFCGSGGRPLCANYIGVLAPAKFDFNYSVEILLMVVMGGMGSITGSIVAAVVLTFLPELLRASRLPHADLFGHPHRHHAL